MHILGLDVCEATACCRILWKVGVKSVVEVHVEMIESEYIVTFVMIYPLKC